MHNILGLEKVDVALFGLRGCFGGELALTAAGPFEGRSSRSGTVETPQGSQFSVCATRSAGGSVEQSKGAAGTAESMAWITQREAQSSLL